MTPLTERNKRFDEKFTDSNIDFIYKGDRDYMKDFLTSEVNLIIEQVEKWAEENKLGGHYDEEKRIFAGGYDQALSDLLSFLTTLKK